MVMWKKNFVAAALFVWLCNFWNCQWVRTIVAALWKSIAFFCHHHLFFNPCLCEEILMKLSCCVEVFIISCKSQNHKLKLLINKTWRGWTVFMRKSRFLVDWIIGERQVYCSYSLWVSYSKFSLLDKILDIWRSSGWKHIKLDVVVTLYVGC